MNKIVALALILALSGCADNTWQHEVDLAWAACRAVMTDPAHSACVSQHLDQQFPQYLARQRQSEDNAAAAATTLELLNAGMAGYNQGRATSAPISTSCTTNRGITNCLSY